MSEPDVIIQTAGVGCTVVVTMAKPILANRRRKSPGVSPKNPATYVADSPGVSPKNPATYVAGSPGVSPKNPATYVAGSPVLLNDQAAAGCVGHRLGLVIAKPRVYLIP